jgi:hypothetical protein
MDSVFLQSLSAGGDIPVSRVSEVTYIEGCTLNYPRLILLFSDYDADIRNEYGIDFETEIEARMGDVEMPDGEELTETFVVLAKPKQLDDKRVLVECLQKDVYELKKPANGAELFNDSSPDQVISALMPNVDVSLRGVRGRGTYHLNPEDTRSALLKQMAKEFGALIYYNRGTLNMVAYSELSGQSITKEFEQNNTQAEHGAWSVKLLYSCDLQANKKRINPAMWDKAQGYVYGVTDGYDVAFPQLGQDKLEHINKHLAPCVQFMARGTTQIQPADKTKLVLHRLNEDSVLDESVEEEQFIIEVAHHQRGFSYLLQMTSGVVHE